LIQAPKYHAFAYSVGSADARGNPQEEQVPEVFEVAQAPSLTDSNIFPEQGKPHYIPTYVFNVFALSLPLV
jgi:hypothetical protein